jgi:hypothetical protein
MLLIQIQTSFALILIKALPTLDTTIYDVNLIDSSVDNWSKNRGRSRDPGAKLGQPKKYIRIVRQKKSETNEISANPYRIARNSSLSRAEN